MAGYLCKQCDGAENAVVLITPLNGADSQPVGDECLAVTLTGWLSMVVGLDPEALWAEIERLKATPPAPQDGQADTGTAEPKPPGAKPGTRRTATARRTTPPARKAAKQLGGGGDGQAQTEPAGQS